MKSQIMVMLGILAVVFIAGCTSQKPTHKISGTQGLLPDEQDLQQLGMTSDRTDCLTEEYPTNEHSPLAQYSFCNYTINSLNDTVIVLQLKKYTNFEDLNGAYQYDSQHLFSIEGLISENDYGDQSRFRVNHENDYMGHLNEPGVYYYHLWICKNEYLIHITSKGTMEAEDYIARIGRQILSQFE